MKERIRPGACRSRLATAALLAAGLVACWLPAAARRADEPPPVMDELTVTGERTGPGMWHVRRGAADLWILGSMSPLPKGITWRSKQLEQTLDSANQVVVPKPFEIGIARVLWLLITERDLLMVRGGKRLKDVMPPELHARFALQRAKYTTDSVLSLPPPFCSKLRSTRWVCPLVWILERRCAHWRRSITCASRNSRLRAFTMCWMR
jgi:TraB/PrgY/gumN family